MQRKGKCNPFLFPRPTRRHTTTLARVSGRPIGQFMFQQIVCRSLARSHLSFFRCEFAAPFGPSAPIDPSLPLSLLEVNRSCKMSPAVFPSFPTSASADAASSRFAEYPFRHEYPKIRDCHAPHSLTPNPCQDEHEIEEEREGEIQPRVTYTYLMQSGAEISPSILPSLRCGLALAVCMPLSLLCSLSISLFPLTLIFSSAATHDVTLCSLAPPPSYSNCDAPFAIRRSLRRA